MIHIKIADLAIDIMIFKFFPAVTGLFAFWGVGGGIFGFFLSLIVAAGIKVALFFFEKEIKHFSYSLRERWDRHRIKGKDKK
ncbi:hypothetical protein [Flagellimonas marina]|uniref:Uncharacterized protein n=1 Tax=Flagellimonas marina TaxID=1775168 RepID=A0ABV8PJD1_9FLAO